jgi:hypothetical protein
VVSGTVTYKGKPVNNAALQIYPTQGDYLKPITIPVGEDGTFRIADVPPGPYKVVVEGSEGGSEVPDLSNVPPDKRAQMKEKLDRMAGPSRTIDFPKKYKDSKTTDLTCTITDQNQTLNLELKD